MSGKVDGVWVRVKSGVAALTVLAAGFAVIFALSPARLEGHTFPSYLVFWKETLDVPSLTQATIAVLLGSAATLLCVRWVLNRREVRGLVGCSACGRSIGQNAATCVSCGEPNRARRAA